ncbi:MAG TPA: S1/P1 nuclease [Verrucomicrobiae bacterium]|nr:S1/P1 nuclease [Verrucomicrobiae bacterium]
MPPYVCVDMKAIRLAALSLLLPCLTADQTCAWNESGHMTIAELAWRKLSNNERNAITTLLRQHPHYAFLLATNIPKKALDTNEWIFLRAATWPDMVRPPRRGAPPKPAIITNHHRGDWHFTNAPYVAPADLATTHPPAQGEGRILEAIAANEALVKNQTKPAADRAVALCWLLHLYGDLHQPLHCVARFSPEFPNGDRGGNGEAILPRSAPVVLHAFWDDTLGGGESPHFIEHTADTIASDPAHTTARLQTDLAHTTVPQWAQESIDEAETFAYLDGNLAHAKIPPGGLDDLSPAAVPALNTGYEATAETIARRRAALAGRRLGTRLKALF